MRWTATKRPTRSAASPSPTAGCGSRSPRRRSRAARRPRCASRFATRDGPVRDFEVTHEKRMHLIVVRRDGRGFQHLHPTLGADGTWSAPITLADAGAYRVFADFQRDGEPHTLAADLTVDGAADYAPFPRPRPAAETDGYTVELDAHGDTLGFAITRGGKPVEDRAVPRRRRPPGRAARGRSRVPARAPDEATASRSRPSSRRTPATGCTCSSSTTAASTPRSSRDEHDDRAADHRHDVRVVREPHRAQAEQARRRPRERQLRHREGDRRLRPGGGRARRAGRRRRGRGLPRGAPGDRARRARGRRDRGAALPADPVGDPLAAGPAGLDDPGAAVRQLAVAGAQRSPRRSCSGARGRSTGPPGRTCATARRRWTR